MSGKPAGRPGPLIWTQPPPPARQRSLDREVIVRAAVAIADEGGPGALTMTAVARRLGPYSPMALYRYVSSKDGLVDLMLDAVTAEIPTPDEPGPEWRDDLHTLATRTWAAVRRHIWYAQLVHTRPPVGPNMMRHTDFMLAVFARLGVPAGTAMTYAALIYRHVYGTGLQEAEETRMQQRYGIDSPEEFLAAMQPIRELAAADGRYPHLAAWLAAPSGATADERFELGLTFLLDGIAARLPGARPPASG